MNIKILNSYFIEKDTMLLHRLNKYTINKILKNCNLKFERYNLILIYIMSIQNCDIFFHLAFINFNISKYFFVFCDLIILNFI